jgi:integrase
MAEAAQ